MTALKSAMASSNSPFSYRASPRWYKGLALVGLDAMARLYSVIARSNSFCSRAGATCSIAACAAALFSASTLAAKSTFALAIQPRNSGSIAASFRAAWSHTFIASA